MNSVSKKETSASPVEANLVDPQAEVRKLQELVKRLELQNELLRSKQKLNNGDVDTKLNQHNGSTGHNNSHQHNHQQHNHHNNHHSQQHQNNSCSNNNSTHQTVEDDVDIIDVNSISSKDDEFSWLYSSPKPPTERQTQVSPYMWVREEFDHPKAEVKLARKSLVLKLEEVARLSKTSPTLSGSYTIGNHVPSTKSRLSTSELSSTSTPSHVPSIKQPLLSTLGTRVDTNTFTRPKKNKESLRLLPVESTSNKETEPQSQVANRIPDVSDIQNMAKLQEESLRQSISPLSSPRKVYRPRQIPQPSSSAGISDSEPSTTVSPVGSNRSSPGRDESMSSSRRNSHSMASNGGSESNSPPDSPFSSQNQINCINHHPQDEGRRGMSNMYKLVTPPPPIYSSDSSLDACSDEMLYVAGGTPESATRQPSRLQQPGRPTSPLVSNLKQPNNVRRGSSPIRSNLPQPGSMSARRSIPRPSSAPRSSLPAPRRSGIPFKPQEKPPTSAITSPGYDDSWKEGCF
ncbi:SLAIN motif-containing protein 2 isoform X2 [Octopus bimaculoides]|uniref:SLAIN motif-containing protein 2 isoform X2 n=1 Tax=Octopus bimaculoides TaxID=37653 RepID=UPI00071C6E95|nr:SLAIN motif-containing protein 2 isoform X2 [Octopus bimaculoides]|eukprot:XP_014786564.1 PREDICTED: SLAIN motif-containing protein 2-like isoform X2 [Octopus bimaculoides]